MHATRTAKRELRPLQTRYNSQLRTAQVTAPCQVTVLDAMKQASQAGKADQWDVDHAKTLLRSLESKALRTAKKRMQEIMLFNHAALVELQLPLTDELAELVCRKL